MNRDQRYEAVMQDLHRHGRVEVVALARRFDVSEMTVRRDLDELVRQGVATRVHGGALSAISRSYETPFALRASRAQDAKRRIAERVVAELHGGQTVFLDVGSTTLEVAQQLRGASNLTIVTPGLRHALELADEHGINTIMLQGAIRPVEHSVYGPMTSQALSGMNVDVVILGADGLSVSGGLTEFSLDDAAVKQAAIAQGGRVIVVLDESKLGTVAFAVVARISRIDCLVTDAPPENRHVRELAAAGVEILHA